MTDEELLRRVAEIEGAEWTCFDSDQGIWYYAAPPDFERMWNPLELPGDAFELVEKYRVVICPEFTCSPEKPQAEYSGEWEAELLFDADHKAAGVVDPSLPRAILLAIVASQEEP